VSTPERSPEELAAEKAAANYVEYTDGKPWKVKELIALLQQEDPEAFVVTEGCDCVGDWSGVVEPYKDYTGRPTVCINRDDSRGRR
jgi:hypothetical protein